MWIGFFALAPLRFALIKNIAVKAKVWNCFLKQEHYNAGNRQNSTGILKNGGGRASCIGEIGRA